MNLKKIILIFSFFIFMTSPLFAETGNVDSMVTLFIPAGDPQAGRQAFIDLKCIACHEVDGDEALPKPFSANPGPTLGLFPSFQTPGELADAIIFPSHSIGQNTYPEGKSREPSPMGDFTQSMTVRQLIDLLAYIRSFQ